MLYIPTWEERTQSKAERAEIIDAIMDIRNPKILHRIAIMVRSMANKESMDHPMQLDEFINLLDPEMIVELRKLFRNEDSKYVANAQIKELLENTWALYTGIEPENKTA